MKNLLNYLFCVAVAVLLCIYISGTGGMFILCLLLVAIIMSAILVVVTGKNLSVGISLPTEIADKGEELNFQLEVKKGSVLPTCFVEVEFELTPNITTAHKKIFKLIAAKKSGDVVDIPVKAELCGEGKITIKNIVLMDYLGIIRKKTNLCNESEISTTLKIMPVIHDTGVQTDVLKATAENAASTDDDEDESDEAAIGLTGVAGYEHRKYETGDPLKRVNWKLSSKRDILMVRLDDKVLTSSQDFVLDYPEREDADRLYYENADRIIEASLSMLSMLLMQGYESVYSYYLDGWKTVEINDEKGLLLLQQELAGIKPCQSSQRISQAQLCDTSVICFTTCTADMNRELSVFTDTKGCSLVVTQTSGISKICSNMWSVNELFDFVKL